MTVKVCIGKPFELIETLKEETKEATPAAEPGFFGKLLGGSKKKKAVAVNKLQGLKQTQNPLVKTLEGQDLLDFDKVFNFGKQFEG